MLYNTKDLKEYNRLASGLSNEELYEFMFVTRNLIDKVIFESGELALGYINTVEKEEIESLGKKEDLYAKELSEFYHYLGEERVYSFFEKYLALTKHSNQGIDCPHALKILEIFLKQKHYWKILLYVDNTLISLLKENFSKEDFLKSDISKSKFFKDLGLHETFDIRDCLDRQVDKTLEEVFDSV